MLLLTHHYSPISYLYFLYILHDCVCLCAFVVEGVFSVCCLFVVLVFFVLLLAVFRLLRDGAPDDKNYVVFTLFLLLFNLFFLNP